MNMGDEEVKRRQSKCQASCMLYMGRIPEVPIISAREALELKNTSQDNVVVLIDVRSCPEQRTSMIRGALTQEEFDAKVKASELPPGAILIPYCTIGYRSGQFGKRLQKQFPESTVKNHEGILMHTYTSESLVKRGSEGEQDSEATVVHTHSYPWSSMQHPRYSQVYFGPRGLCEDVCSMS